MCALACLSVCIHSARIARKRSNDTSRTSTSSKRGYRGNVTAASHGHHGATAASARRAHLEKKVGSAEHKWQLPEQARSHQVQLSDVHSAKVALSTRRNATGRGEEEAASAGDAAAPLGCFTEAGSSVQLGCMAGCPCSWFHRCYPKFVAPGQLPTPGVPPPAQRGSSSDQAAGDEGDEKELVNVGHCSMGVVLMIFFTMLGFMAFVCCIVLFRAGSLAMQAVKEQAEESAKVGSVLNEIRAKAIRTPMQLRRSTQGPGNESGRAASAASAGGGAQMPAARAG